MSLAMSRAAPHRGPSTPRIARSRMTLAALRRRFWWLGAVSDGSHIVALRRDVATVKVIQTSWVPRTARYEAAVANDFAEIGLRVEWVRSRSEKLKEEIARAQKEASAAETPFDEAAFIARKQQEEEKSRAATPLTAAPVSDPGGRVA